MSGLHSSVIGKENSRRVIMNQQINHWIQTGTDRARIADGYIFLNCSFENGLGCIRLQRLCSGKSVDEMLLLLRLGGKSYREVNNKRLI